MPEPPDVEYFRRYPGATALHHTVNAIRISDGHILAGVTPQRLTRDLRGHRLERSRRHGKYLFVGTDDRIWLVLHFGMTGGLRYFKVRVAGRTS